MRAVVSLRVVRLRDGGDQQLGAGPEAPACTAAARKTQPADGQRFGDEGDHAPGERVADNDEVVDALECLRCRCSIVRHPAVPGSSMGRFTQTLRSTRGTAPPPRAPTATCRGCRRGSDQTLPRLGQTRSLGESGREATGQPRPALGQCQTAACTREDPSLHPRLPRLAPASLPRISLTTQALRDNLRYIRYYLLSIIRERSARWSLRSSRSRLTAAVSWRDYLSPWREDVAAGGPCPSSSSREHVAVVPKA